MLHGPNILPLNTIEILRSGRVLQARRVRVIVEPWKRIQKPLLTRTNVGKGNFHLVIFCTHSGTQLMSWLLLRRDFSFKQVAGFLLTFARKSSVTSITYVIVMTTTSNFRLILFFYSIKYFPEVDGWCWLVALWMLLFSMGYTSWSSRISNLLVREALLYRGRYESSLGAL